MFPRSGTIITRQKLYGLNQSAYRNCCRLRYFFGEMLKFLVVLLPPLPFLLFQFNFILITITVLPFSVPSFVKLNVGCLTVELYILQSMSDGESLMCVSNLGLSFPYYDWRLQSHVRFYFDMNLTNSFTVRYGIQRFNIEMLKPHYYYPPHMYRHFLKLFFSLITSNIVHLQPSEA